MTTAHTSKAVLQIGGYRSKGDIAREILECLREGPQKQTFVMYRAMMSYDQLRTYRAALEDAGLLIVDNENHWTLTDKGRRYVTALQAAENILREAQA